MTKHTLKAARESFLEVDDARFLSLEIPSSISLKTLRLSATHGP